MFFSFSFLPICYGVVYDLWPKGTNLKKLWHLIGSGCFIRYTNAVFHAKGQAYQVGLGGTLNKRA